MERDGLKELQRLFHEAVLVTGPYGEGAQPPRRGFWVPTGGCWFQEMIPGIDACGGDFGPNHIEAAHWIKRQRVEALVGARVFKEGTLWVPQTLEWKWIAAWDPRNAVPACEKHHRRFDSHRMPTLTVPRRLVPEHVVEFTNDQGLETALEDRNPEEVYGAQE